MKKDVLSIFLEHGDIIGYAWQPDPTIIRGECIASRPDTTSTDFESTRLFLMASLGFFAYPRYIIPATISDPIGRRIAETAANLPISARSMNIDGSMTAGSKMQVLPRTKETHSAQRCHGQQLERFIRGPPGDLLLCAREHANCRFFHPS